MANIDAAQLIAAKECGADMAFLEAIETEQQIKNAVRVLSPMPVSDSSRINMIELNNFQTYSYL